MAGRVPSHSQKPLAHARALSAYKVQGSTTLSQSTPEVLFHASEQVSLAISANPELARRQAELSYAHDCWRCCFCGSRTVRRRSGEKGRMRICSPLHRSTIQATTEGRGRCGCDKKLGVYMYEFCSIVLVLVYTRCVSTQQRV